MKILFVAPANSIHTVRWVNALAQKGNQITLVSLANHMANMDFINTMVEVLYLPYRGSIGYYLNSHQLKKIEETLHPDIINVHYASGYGTLARVARLPDIILSVWGSDVYDFPYQNLLNMIIIKKNLKYAKNIASTSIIMAKQVEKLIATKKISVTPFGVNIDVFKKIIVSKENTDVFTIGVVKTLEDKYGIDMVIRAFSIFNNKMQADSVQKKLLIFGEGSKKRELVNLCKELKIEDKVQFKGIIANNKVPLVLNEMDVVCFGSRQDSESFGVAAVEAMACEVPVIATDVDGFKEVIDKDRTGYIVGREDAEKMSDYLLALYLDPPTRAKMGGAGRKRVMQFYNWENNVDEMLRLYQDSLKEKQ